MDPEIPTINLDEIDSSPAAQLLSGTSREYHSLVRTMALVAGAKGQKAWGKKMAEIGLNTNDEGKRLTEVSIAVVMKSLRSRKIVETPASFRHAGVWLKREFVLPVLKHWLEDNREEFLRALEARLSVHLDEYRGAYHYYGEEKFEEESAISLCFCYYLTEQWDRFEEIFSQIDDNDIHHSIAMFFCRGLNWERFSVFPDTIKVFLFRITFAESMLTLSDSARIANVLKSAPYMHTLRDYGEIEILRGNFKEAEEAAAMLIEQPHEIGSAYGWILRSWLAFLEGKDDEVLACYEKSMAAILGETRKKKAYPEGLSAVFALLGMIRADGPNPATKTSRYLGWARELETGCAYEILREVQIFNTRRSYTNEVQIEEENHNACLANANEEKAPLCALLGLLAVNWTTPEVFHTHESEVLDKLRECARLARENGYRWVEMEILQLAAEITSDSDASQKSKEQADAIRSSLSLSTVPLTTLVTPVPAWEKSLSTLEEFFSPDRKEGAAETSEKQFVWGLRAPYYTEEYTLHPFERTVLKSGKWSVPKKVSMQQLREEYSSWPHLSDADRKMAASIRSSGMERWMHHSLGGLELAATEVLEHLVDHPAIYRMDMKPDLKKPVRFREIEPTVSLNERKDGSLSLEIRPLIDEFNSGEIFVNDDGGDLIEFCAVTQTLIKLSRTFQTERSRHFPVEAKEKLSRILGSLAGSIRVEGDATATAAEGAQEVPSDGTIRLRMIPFNEGLTVTAQVLPLGPEGPAFPPGQGSEVVFGRNDDGPVRAIRDLAAEAKQIKSVINRSEILSSFKNGDQCTWDLQTVECCLQLLLEIREMPEEIQPVLEWPEGETVSIKAIAGSESFSMRLNSKSDWLEANGELQVDEDTILTLQTLLKLIETSGSSRFIELDTGQYIALTERLKRQIADIGALAKDAPKKPDDAFELPTLAAHLLDELVEESDATTDSEWKQRINQLEEAAKLKIRVPTTLQADLRPYQKEGFQWLARLAHWTSGACLADDMGLGKTIQALALLLRRAKDGPALIVAPVSVAANWADETQRFAPTLNVKMFRGPNRAEILENPGARDLIIATYGLLQSEADLFAEVEWNTVVIDEAQAIKNRNTLRYKAAMRLSAKFRLITTGTPIENHLQELYNLFHFTHPGLLGNLTSFQSKFAVPIEQRKSAATRDRLRRLINPFILRRLKRDVLKDLPEKTEITLQVEMSEEETAFYEAIRRNAVETIDNNADDKGAVRILAELMRLRRACCNPALVDKENAPPSSKLKVFQNTLEELLSNNHKVLVFSQFVDHLSLLRDHLDETGISYQYLDGSTSPKKRKAAIDLFQSGEGDVFLISLKAGGFGLNLTAANYVIHMDPWWNPAVEDQASDRAHRIGQTQPVTIYRMVTKGTIEEKIVTLHHQKRELADSLLAGTDSVTKLTAKQLKELLTED